ncbi:hypothetical protein [Polaromonas sp. JS666]|uniref:hypothetical protein n=1 Tax=Polaromonas sp. (strain JS666 / ATCC BAA-500) TaxID=296591 RepID=UPI0000464B54|nr:hypothetical protein [Polaromonas sp. JS666]ABE45653.1 hypothetical protein Bpro_3754 [Polaromonas sp. JS666]
MGRTIGARCKAPKADNLARKQAWQAMRIMRRFTRADILTTAAINQSNLDKYLRALINTGFVVVQQERVSGRPGSRDVLRIARDNGPKPPVAHTDGSMLDPNTGQTWHYEEAEAKRPFVGMPAADAADAAEGQP